MFTPLRVIGAVLVLGAIVALGLDLVALFREGYWAPQPLGGLWASLHVSSLNGFQVVIEREEYLDAPGLWNGFVFPLLQAPVWLVAGLPGALLLLLAWSPWRRSAA